MASLVPEPIQPDIVRANQRDDYFSELIHKQLEKGLRVLWGSDFVAKYSKEIRLSSDFLYFYLTTAGGRRTLGEEYVDLLPVTPSGSLSGARRFASVAARCFSLYAVERCATSPNMRANWPRLQSLFQKLNDLVVPAALKLHLAYFFIFGGPMNVSERLLGVRFKFLSTSQRPRRNRNIILATVLILHALMSIYTARVKLFSPGVRTATRDAVSAVSGFAKSCGRSVAGRLCPAWVASKKEDEEVARVRSKKGGAKRKQAGDDFWGANLDEGGAQSCSTGDVSRSTNFASSGRKVTDVQGVVCLFCTCESEHPACGPCGHVFCWECLAMWLTEKGVCPTCRERCSPQEMVRVLHWDANRCRDD